VTLYLLFHLKVVLRYYRITAQNSVPMEICVRAKYPMCGMLLTFTFLLALVLSAMSEQHITQLATWPKNVEEKKLRRGDDFTCSGLP
jgi:hypothetical protein